MLPKSTAIVLGGTFPHITLIKKLKNRGYKTVLVDFAESPIAKEFADEHILESSLDKEKVLQIAKNVNADLVITTCSDQANVTASYVAGKLNLPAPYSYEIALSVTDKEIMKKTMSEYGIPTSTFLIMEKDWHISETASLKFPIIVKPSDGYGSKAVRVANNTAELKQNIVQAIETSRNGKAIVEEFIEGVEIGIDCFVTDREAKIIMTKQRHKIKNLGNEIQQIYGCTWPAVLNNSVEKKLQVISNQIAHAFQLKNTPLMIQAVVRDNEVFVIEFGARIGGGNSYNIILERTGFDMIDASINSFLSQDVDLNYEENDFYYADLFLYMKSSQFGRIANVQKLLDDKIIIDCIISKQKGTLIGEDLSSRNRIGSLILRAETLEELLLKMKKSIETVEIYDTNNEPKMRKELYSF